MAASLTAPSPSRWRPSVTVAAVVTEEIDGETRYLLVEEDTPEGLKLNNPAGHLDPGESPEQGVVRETLEETTRTFVPQALVGIYLSRFQRPARGEDVTYLRITYAGTVGPADAARTLDHGIHRTLWLTLDEIRAAGIRLRSDLVLRCVEDHARGVRYPMTAIETDPSIWEPELKPGA